MQHHVSLLDRHPRLQRHEGLEAYLRARLHPAGVHQRKFPARPLGPVVRPIARGTRSLRDYGTAAAHDPVYQRALPHVGGPDDGDYWEASHSDPPVSLGQGVDGVHDLIRRRAVGRPAPHSRVHV